MIEKEFLFIHRIRCLFTSLSIHQKKGLTSEGFFHNIIDLFIVTKEERVLTNFFKSKAFIKGYRGGILFPDT
jgi:hypothetical protein